MLSFNGLPTEPDWLGLSLLAAQELGTTPQYQL